MVVVTPSGELRHDRVVERRARAADQLLEVTAVDNEVAGLDAAIGVGVHSGDGIRHTLFAVFALAFGAQGAFAAPDDLGGTPGKSPYYKTRGDQSSHAKPGKGGGKGLGHCKHSLGGCASANSGDNGDDDNGSDAPALARTGA
jgi:hypothetical protein